MFGTGIVLSMDEQCVRLNCSNLTHDTAVWGYNLILICDVQHTTMSIADLRWFNVCNGYCVGCRVFSRWAHIDACLILNVLLVIDAVWCRNYTRMRCRNNYNGHGRSIHVNIQKCIITYMVSRGPWTDSMYVKLIRVIGVWCNIMTTNFILIMCCCSQCTTMTMTALFWPSFAKCMQRYLADPWQIESMFV